VTYPGPEPSVIAPPGAYTVPPPFASPPVAPDGRLLANFGDRLVARIVDTLIAMAVSFALLVPWMILMIGAITAKSETLLLVMALGTLVILVISLLFSYLYEVELQLKRGQTVGKRIVRIAVAPIAPGAQLTRAMLAKRWLIWGLASAFVPFLIWIDGLWQLWDKPYLQCLHDKFAETVVVKVSP
jgi:uncharacterized RDD family membrane protein YckC